MKDADEVVQTRRRLGIIEIRVPIHDEDWQRLSVAAQQEVLDEMGQAAAVALGLRLDAEQDNPRAATAHKTP